MDGRIYSGIGFWVLCVLGYVVFQHAGAAIFFGLIGGALGRFIASRKAKDS